MLLAVVGGAAWSLPAIADTVQDFARAERLIREGDVATAMPLLRRLADAGYAPAQARLGDLLDKSEDNAAAVDYYRKAAAQGDADGAYGLASMYAAGEGVPADAGESLRWLRVAAEASHPQAVNMLAQAYLVGEPTLKAQADYAAQAVRWLERAAGNGFIPAMDGLARAYRGGEFGLTPDAAQAQAWQSKADAARRALASRSERQDSPK
jgi:TPR repeat protein